MKFFIDSAEIKEIEEAASMGVLDGVTTNPSLMAKAGVQDPDTHYAKICDLVPGDVSAEVIATDYEGIMQEARHLASLHKQIVVKVPMIHAGVQAIKSLAEEGIPVNCTLIFSPMQALVAAKAGARYLSPFVGRLDDIQHDGMELIRQIRQILDNYGFEAQILAASMRSPRHIQDSALIGADVVTMPFSVVQQLIQHPLTDRGLEKFLADHQKQKQTT
jgi:transaldolase